MNKFRRFAAILCGLVFLISGLLKLLDPVGTGLIVSAYYQFFGLKFLEGTSQAAGVALALLESLLGTALVTGVFRKLTGILSGILTLLFTGVTLALLVKNPEMDCGCFGEAVHLTHLQSFLKNLVLLALLAVAFLPMKNLGDAKKKGKLAFWVTAAGLVVAAVYNQRHLPTVDFTDFAPGNELLASLDNDYEEFDDKVRVHVYKRGDQEGFFTENRLPDSTWTFVRIDTLDRNGIRFEEKTPSLSFKDDMGGYQDELAVLGKVLILSVPAHEKMDPEAWDALVTLKDDAEKSGINPLLLVTEGTPVETAVPALLQPYAYFSDYKTLITLNRSNGGATYLDNGMIIRKWHLRDLPDFEGLDKLAGTDPVDATVATVTRSRLRAQGFLLYLLAVLIIL